MDSFDVSKGTRKNDHYTKVQYNGKSDRNVLRWPSRAGGRNRLHCISSD